MREIPRIDIHTHRSRETGDGIAIQNMMAGSSGKLPTGSFSIGIHPHYLDKPLEELISEVSKLSSLKHAVAIGECGLDTLSPFPMELQEKAFIAQLELAKSVSKPLIFHCVRAAERLVWLYRKYAPGVPAIVHGYNSKKNIAQLFLRNGIYISFGKALMRPDSNASGQISKIPHDLLFLETDDAEISLEKIYEQASLYTGLSDELLKKIIFENYQRIFK